MARAAGLQAMQQQVLTTRGIEMLIMMGITTEDCVSSTLRAAADRG